MIDRVNIAAAICTAAYHKRQRKAGSARKARFWERRARKYILQATLNSVRVVIPESLGI